jgi:hypothetical protein
MASPPAQNHLNEPWTVHVPATSRLAGGISGAIIKRHLLVDTR